MELVSALVGSLEAIQLEDVVHRMSSLLEDRAIVTQPSTGTTVQNHAFVHNTNISKMAFVFAILDS
jgi:hypothetical protein